MAAGTCGGVDPYDVFSEFGSTAEPVRVTCYQSFLRCYEPKLLSGPEIRVKDPDCCRIATCGGIHGTSSRLGDEAESGSGQPGRR